MTAPTRRRGAPPEQPAGPGLEQDETVWHDGYTRGHTDGLHARPPADVLVPVPTRWRHVHAGDTFTSPRGDLWHVTHADPGPRGVTVAAVHAGRTANHVVDPDEQVTVLISTSEHDAITLARNVLGARITARTPGGDR